MNKLGFLKDKYPLLVCAPMVDQSELAFRLLTRRYGSNLCYTPMLHSRMLITQKTYKNEHFTTCPEDRPLVAQLCGDDPETLLKAAQMLENEVDAIDLNFGCPQGIARKGHYGSFLLAEPDLIIRIVETMSAGLKVPLFCKMRVLKDEEKTLDLAKRMEKAGCSLLAVHGRTKEQNKERVGLCDWSIIRKIKETLKIPVLANGGVYNYADVQSCLEQTGADGVMSAQSLLENPALFSNTLVDLDQLAREYLDLAKKYVTGTSAIKAHLFKILYKGLSIHTDLRDRLAKASFIEEFDAVVNQIMARRKEVIPEQKLGWYFRYRKGKMPEFGTVQSRVPEIEQEENKNKPQQKKNQLPKETIEQNKINTMKPEQLIKQEIADLSEPRAG